MDITDFFKTGFKNLRKDLVDKNYRKKSLQARKESLINARRVTRDTLRFNHRNIDPNNMSPFTPVAPINKNKETPVNKKIPEKKEVVNTKRIEMLKQWKEKKIKQKQEEQKRSKPIFKVFHIDKGIGLPNLENVNKEIKGKLIKPVKREIPKSFAPKHHKFTAPNISNKNKCLSDSGIRSSARVAATTTNGRSNLNKDKVGNKKAVKTKVVKELNTEERDFKSQNKAKLVKKVNSENSEFKTTESQIKAPKDNNTPKSLEFKTPESQIKAPKDNIPKSLGFKTPENQFETPNNEVQTKLITERKGTPWFKKTDKGTNNVEENNSNNSIIVIDDSLDELDSEATVRTPIKKHTPRRTPKYTPRPPSARKSHANKDSCILCLDSPISDCMSKTPTRTKTPTRAKTPTRTKTPTRAKTPTSKAKTPITKAETPKTETPKTKTPKNKTPKAKDETFVRKTPKTKTTTPKSNKKSDTNDTFSIDESDEFADNVTKTQNSLKHTPVYVSPFVTISRGKDSARKEYQIRKSTGGTLMEITNGQDFTDITSPRAGAEYFEKILDNEITKIETICDKWEKYKAENEMTEETTDMINVATGQSRLLIAKKFEQFRGLINQCKLCAFKEKLITCEDLHGFWDMIYQQVVDLGKRFDNLERLKDNNWEEILPEKKVIKKKARGRPKKPVATSSLKEIIKAAKNKNKQQDPFQWVVNQPKTPENMNITSPIKVSSSRRSLRVSLLQGPLLKRHSSPGLTMTKITQSIKAGNGITPSKSILKTDLTKSAKRHTKSVLFVEHVLPKKVIFSPEDKENNAKQANLNSSDEVLVNRRRSLRSSKSLSKA